MPLILAIEPDRRQAALLSGLVRRHTGAELILADTTERAIGAIGQRVPDLVLVPALLSPQDDAALAAALRVIAAAAHVQTLTIPVLGLPQPKTSSHGVLSMLRGDHPPASSPDDCDPTVFAGQIVSYLQQLAEERAAATTIDATPFHSADEAETSVQESAVEAPAQGVPPPIYATSAAAPAAEGLELFVDATPGVEAALGAVAAPPDRPSTVPEERPSAEAAADAMDEGTLPRVSHAHSPTAEDAKDAEVKTVDSSASFASSAVAKPTNTYYSDPKAALDAEMTGLEEALLSLGEKLSAEGQTETSHQPTPEPDLTIELDELRLAMERRAFEWIGDRDRIALTELDAVPRDSAARESAESTAVVGDPIDTPEAEARAPTLEPTRVTPRPQPVTRKGGAEWGKLIESLRHDLDRLDAERQHWSGTPAASHLDESRIPSSPRPTGTAEPGVRNRHRRSTRPTPPIQDEWGFFDPEQCGFAALLAKLDEITEEREALTRRRA